MTTLREKIATLFSESEENATVEDVIALVVEHLESDEVRGIVYAAMTRFGPPFHSVSRALGEEVRR